MNSGASNSNVLPVAEKKTSFDQQLFNNSLNENDSPFRVGIMTPVGDEIDHIVHTKIGLAGPGAVMGSINVFVLISLIVCGLFRNFRTSTAQCFLNLSSDVE